MSTVHLLHKPVCCSSAFKATDTKPILRPPLPQPLHLEPLCAHFVSLGRSSSPVLSLCSFIISFLFKHHVFLGSTSDCQSKNKPHFSEHNEKCLLMSELNLIQIPNVFRCRWRETTSVLNPNPEPREEEVRKSSRLSLFVQQPRSPRRRPSWLLEPGFPACSAASRSAEPVPGRRQTAPCREEGSEFERRRGRKL